MGENRNLTEDDVKAIVDEIEKRTEERFFSNLGKGIWSLAWRAIVVLLIGLAAYGALKG